MERPQFCFTAAVVRIVAVAVVAVVAGAALS
jgi:hypothetical protein